MSDLNTCLFIGRLAADPETRYTQSGTPVCNFRIAVGETWKDKNTGQKQEKANFLSMVAFNKVGEIIQQYCTKGSRIRVSTKAQVRQWQAQDGSNRYATEFVVQELQLLDSKQQSQGNQQQGQNQPPQQQRQQSPQQQNQQFQQPPNNSNGPGSFDDFDSDIPFLPAEYRWLV